MYRKEEASSEAQQVTGGDRVWVLLDKRRGGNGEDFFALVSTLVFTSSEAAERYKAANTGFDRHQVRSLIVAH